MKLVFFEFSRRLGTKLSLILFGLALSPFAAMGAPLANWNSVDFGSFFTTPPQIDATNFNNAAVWTISTSPSSVPTTLPPYETTHTLNYTNKASMTCTYGWEFDYGSPDISGRTNSSNFFNDNNGVIQANDGPVQNHLQEDVQESTLIVWATNIVNRGLLVDGAGGQIILTGANIDLNHSAGLEIAPIAGIGSASTPTNFTPDTAIYDDYWLGSGTNLTVSGSPWNGTTLGAFTGVGVGEPCGVSNATITIGPFTPNPTNAIDSFVTTLGSYIQPITNSGGGVTGVPAFSNLIHQAAFVYTGSNSTMTAQIRFSGSFSNGFKTVAVRLATEITNAVTAQLQPITVYVVDSLAASTNRGLIQNTILNPASDCALPGFRPSAIVVARTDPGAFSSGSTGLGVPPATFFYDPANFTNAIVTGGAVAAYSATIDNVAAQVPDGSSVTNLPGRVRIYAGSLNLNQTPVRAEGQIMVQATNLVSSANAVLDCQNLSFDLSSISGNLNFVNLATANVNRLHGVLDMWSGLWTNTMIVVYPNNYTPVVTNVGVVSMTNYVLAPLTNYITVGLALTAVDASGLASDQTPVTVQDLRLHSTNIVVTDSATVDETFLLDGLSATLNGNLILSGALQDWTAANAPTLLYFTNSGFLSIPNNAIFGADTAAPYTEFFNSGTIQVGGLTLDTLDLQVTANTNEFNYIYTFYDGFTATAQSVELTGANIYSAGDIQFFANTMVIDPSVIYSFDGAVDFAITNSLSDNGTANSITCNNGFNLWIKPNTGDLLGSTITSIATSGIIDHAWAGEDRGANLTGFTNNVAIGTLALVANTQNRPPLFEFYGAAGNNAMYVSTLDLSQLTTSSANLTSMIQIDPGMKIYFQSVLLGFNPPGSQTPESFLQSQFPGQFVQAPNFVVAQSGMSVDGTNTFQRIDGFGASSAWQSTWTTNEADVLFSTNNGVVYTDSLGNTTTNNGIALSLLRSRVAPGGTTVENNIMQWAQTRGARVWSTPWSPAVGFKVTNNIYGTLPISNPLYGGSILATIANYQAYANQLASYVLNMKNIYGINLYAISVQNEPDAQVNGYEACQWTPQEIHDFVPYLHSALISDGVGSTLIMLPESQNWPDYQALANTAMNDSSVAADVGIIADHNYDGVNGPTSLSKNSYGKALWETEVSKLSGNDSSMNDGVYWGSRIYLFMTQAQANAYHYWWLMAGNSTGNQGLLDNHGSITKRLFVLGQYSRFVRPGYYRIGVNTVNSNLLVSAYEDTNSLNFAIVAVNNTPNFDITQTFSLTNLSVTSVTPWITSSSQSLAPQTSVNVTGGSFSYLIPAKSVVTFVGQATSTSSSVRPALQPVPGQTINAGVTLTVTNVAMDPNAPPAVTFSLLAGPTNATLGATFNYTNALFTWRPLVSQANTTNLITVKVVDSASQSATSSFTVTVNPLTQPTLSSIVSSGGQVNLTVKGPAGPDYTLWTSTNLVNWQVLSTTNSPPMPLTLTVSNHNDSMRFYRLQLGP